MTAWYAGKDRHTKQSLTQTNRSPDAEHCAVRNM